MKTLDQLSVGQNAVVNKINGSNEQLRRRLIDMGIIPGTNITMCKKAPMGDPIEITLRGYQLTLRKDDTKHIFVEVV